ncbi:spermatogenesis-associated serine-rich protein 1 isoform X1 [Macrotis lagotis]|uniref:spermatogenesis-associated serine-rich protein 1 isoform X1 n=1 Tax=Macrotis lagotis TaxID=92651 RepID=UPI003D686A72
MEPNGSLTEEGVKENGANGNGSLESKEHSLSAIDVNPLPDPVPSSVAEYDASVSCLQDVPKGHAPNDHPVADRELQPSPFPSMKVIDVPLVTQVGENDYPREVKLLHQKGAEWSFYPREGHLHTYCKGKRCYFNGVYCAYQRCSTEMTLDKSFGRKKYDIDPRNGIPELIPGDKVYLNVEDSPDFYKHGATIPPVNFSKTPYIKKVDTFIPLEPLPQEYHLPYSERKKKEEKNTEIMEVKELNEWKPAIPIMEWLFPNVLQHTKRVIII